MENQEIELLEEKKEDEFVVETTKICSKCGEEKGVGEFYIRDNGHRRNECKECLRKKNKERWAPKRLARIEKEKNKTSKICSTCGIEKDFECFNKEKHGKYGLKPYCKECRKKYDKEYRKENKDVLYEKQKEYCKNNKDKIKNYPSKKNCSKYTRRYEQKIIEGKIQRIERNTKVCYTCKIEKNIDEFFKSKHSIDSHVYECKECRKIGRKKYLSKEENKIKVREADNKRIKNNPLIRLHKNISRAILFALKENNGSKKGYSIFNFLPYNVRELKEHIEKQWESWMNWKNYGIYKDGDGIKKWHIDHIIPKSKLPYDSMEHPNFQKCWALENLRPLEAIENMKKGDKIL